MHEGEPLGGDGEPPDECGVNELGVFEKIFGKREPAAAAKAKATFQLLEGYTPEF